MSHPDFATRVLKARGTPARACSRRAARALALFGLPDGPRPGMTDRDRLALAQRIAENTPPASVTFITGPSGGGKSRLARTLQAVLDAREDAPVVVPRPERASPLFRPGASVIDLLPGPVGHALAALAGAGLGEARLIAEPVEALSDGQRARLLLARAMLASRASGGWVLADEFCTHLDTPTARSVCRAMARWARRERRRLVCVSARDELLEALSPEGLIWIDLDQPPLVLLPEKDHARTHPA
ncbi:MAG: hypothetical protein KF866_01315 [Phycisphaeraceae bacterium]|nr:hypothetical protein [Phycisphaeraceae bacterium]MCW5755020.1 hypothetical protein [Phycisphaeraceae bacterium]